jgi:ABC-2 type transport system permease protein
MPIQKALTQFLILKEVAHATFKEWAAYRSHMLLSLVIGPLYFFIQVCVWQAVFHDKTEVGGFTLVTMIRYYSLVTLINYLIMDFATWNLQMLIRTGRFLTFALRPMSHIFFAFSQKAGHRTLGFFLEFLPVYLCFVFVFRIWLVPAEPLWFLISLGFSFCMSFFISYCIGILGFWLVNTDGVRFIYNFVRDLFAGVLIPLTFFPGPAQTVFFFLPFQFVAYVPIRVFFGTYTLSGISLPIPAIVGIQGCAVLIMWAVTRMLFSLGMKRFTGAGA